MEGRAKQKYVRVSSKKVKRILDLIRGKGVREAYACLDFLPKAACVPVKKAVRSAVANLKTAAEGSPMEEETLFIKEATVGGGPTMKRYRAGAMGRATMVRKRTSHITIVVAEEEGGKEV